MQSPSFIRKCCFVLLILPIQHSVTVRFSLDPLSDHSNADYWEPLERAHSKNIMRRNSLSLDVERNA